jgi:hypothetical protein
MTLTPPQPAPSMDEGYPVDMVAGQTLLLPVQAEATWWNSSKDAYLEQTKFSENTDLRDLDRLLQLELMVYRWTQFLAMGHDYTGFDIDEDKLRRAVRDYSAEITKLKQSMSLTKQVRDEAANDGNLSQYIADLKARAKIFGIHRENQLTVALVLMNELSGIVGTYFRSDAEERAKAGFSTEADIVTWIRSTMLPRFHEVDEHFRANEQRYWVRDQ